MHNLLTVVYAVLHDRVPYQELGPDYFVRQDPQRAAHRHVAQLERLGHRVALTPVAAA
jgi:transposase